MKIEIVVYVFPYFTPRIVPNVGVTFMNLNCSICSENVFDLQKRRPIDGFRHVCISYTK
jgi:hypothetical protein